MKKNKVSRNLISNMCHMGLQSWLSCQYISALLSSVPWFDFKCIPKIVPSHCIQHRRNPFISPICLLLLVKLLRNSTTVSVSNVLVYIYKKRTKTEFSGVCCCWRTCFISVSQHCFWIFCGRCRHNTHSLIYTGVFDWVIRSKQMTPWQKCQY